MLLTLLPTATPAQTEHQSAEATPVTVSQTLPEQNTAVAQITRIQLVELADGVQIFLVTDQPDVIEVFQRQTDTTLVVNITNAELALLEGDDYEVLNPIPSVAALRIEQAGGEIQVTVVSNEATVPEVYEGRTPEALLLEVVTLPPGETNISANEGQLRIIVTAAPLGFEAPPNESTRVREGAPITVVTLEPDPDDTTVAEALEQNAGTSSGRTSSSSRATTAIIRGFESNNILRNGLRDDTLRIATGVNNIRQIDILKGPASVEFGSGNLGGTINLITEVPLAEPRYEFGLSAGNESLYGLSLDMTGPLGAARPPGEDASEAPVPADNGPSLLGYRVNLAYENQSSFVDFERSEFFFVAPTFQLANTDRSSLIVDVEYLSNRGYGTSTGLPAISAIGLDNNTLVDTILLGGGLIPELERQRAGTLDIRTNSGEPDLSYSETDIARLGYRLRYDLSDHWTVRNEFLGSFQETRQDSFVAAVNFVQNRGQTDFSALQRIYIDNPSSRDIFTLNSSIAGSYEILRPADAALPTDLSLETGSPTAIGTNDMPLADPATEDSLLLGIDLLLGAEFSYEASEDQITQRLFFPFSVPDSDPFLIFEPNYDSERFFNDGGFSGNPDINLRPGSDSTTRKQTFGLYGQLQMNVADILTILLGGRFDMADQFFVDRVNRGDTSEIDVYDTAFSPRIGLLLKPVEDVALYASYTESFNPVIGRNQLGEVFAPERGRQFEAGLKAELIPNRLGLTFAYYDLRRSNVLTQDPDNLGFQVQVGEQASNGVEVELKGQILPGWDISTSYAYTNARVTNDNLFPVGLQLANVPEQAVSLWSTYEIQAGNLAGVGFGLGLYYQGDRNGELRRPFTLPGYTRTDAALFYNQENFSAQLNIQNLFDVRYFEGARDQFRVIPGAPLSIVGRLNWIF